MSAYDLGGTGATLAARSLTQPHLIVTNQDAAGNLFCYAWQVFLDTDDQFVLVTSFKPDPGANFPYGLLVEPDAPM